MAQVLAWDPPQDQGWGSRRESRISGAPPGDCLVLLTLKVGCLGVASDLSSGELPLSEDAASNQESGDTERRGAGATWSQPQLELHYGVTTVGVFCALACAGQASGGTAELAVWAQGVSHKLDRIAGIGGLTRAAASISKEMPLCLVQEAHGIRRASKAPLNVFLSHGSLFWSDPRDTDSGLAPVAVRASQLHLKPLTPSRGAQTPPSQGGKPLSF